MPFQATLADFERLKHPSAFDKSMESALFPNILLDCLILARRPGIHYLCIDQLYIVQDELHDRKYEPINDELLEH
jgi:hypothetical protein